MKNQNSLNPIKLQQVGRTLIIVADGKKLPPLTLQDKEKRESIKKQIESYNKLPSESKKEKIIKLFLPKTEAKLIAQKVEKKKAKREAIEIKQEIKKIAADLKGEEYEMAKFVTIAKETIKDDRFIVLGHNMFLDPFTTVPLPKELIQELQYFSVTGQSLEPLVNFWQLALLNPNPIARTKLFAYLSRHKLIITPNGYFVTYRMVKKTNIPDVYTSARTGKEGYRMGEVFKLDRKLCDEDGKNDCSRGLHTGTPDFIGIKLGDGYNAGVRIVTKSQGGGYGTGYDAPVTENQQFNDTFGNQAVIVIVNPMHVVSVPDSDTRKLRTCELYFCKTTTAEEVLRLQTSEYSIYDSQYREFEKSQIQAMLAESKLENWVDDTAKAKKKEKLEALLAQQESVRTKVNVGTDNVNEALSLAQINQIIQSRLK